MNKVSYDKLLAKAYSIVAKAYEDVFDDQGRPFIEHCLYVAAGFIDSKRKIKALLHDLVEDGYSTWSKLRKQGFPEDILDTLKRLTHDKEKISYKEYIKGIPGDEDAVDIKKRDLTHNMKPSRMRKLTHKRWAKIEEYHWAFMFLSETQKVKP